MRILLQPAAQGTKAVRGRYEGTILRPVPFADHEDLLSADDRDNLKELFPGDAAPMWGLTPGKRGSNRKKIDAFHVSDAVFFYSDRTLISGGTVAYRLHNPALARRLWGEDDNGLTWEYLYAISDLRRVRIAFTEVTSVIGWSPNAVLQQAHVIADQDAEHLAALWGLDVPTAEVLGSISVPSVPDDSFGGALDRASTFARRAEQGHLKRLLLSHGGGRCALCGREFPAKLLVAAHIKKRAACTDDEKRDLVNIGMLACLLGCDSLYEHGFVAVEEGGRLLTSPEGHEVPALDDYAKKNFVSRTCAWWSPAREPYFYWHRVHTFRMSIGAA